MRRATYNLKFARRSIATLVYSPRPQAGKVLCMGLFFRFAS